MLSQQASRRQLLKLGVGAIAHLCACLSVLALGDPSGRDLDWDGFISELTQLSKFYSPGQEDERNYVKRVSRLLQTLDYRGRSVEDVIRRVPKDKRNEITSASIREDPEFEILFFSLEQGQCFPYHNHPSMTGVSLCLAGQIDIHNLDIVRSPDPATLLVRTSAHEQILSGNISWLTSKVRNIHQVQASKDSKLLDLFTPPYTPERVADTRWYKLEVTGSDRYLYRAHLL